jgi:hypothetical protein
MGSFMSLSLLASFILALQTDAGEPGPAGLSREAFQRAFEEAFEKDDSPRIEELVKQNPTHFLPLFEKYARLWIEHEEQDALARARAIAEAADSALEAPGLLEIVEAQERFEDAQRRTWREAQESQRQGDDACRRFEWREAIEPFERAERAF